MVLPAWRSMVNLSTNRNSKQRPWTDSSKACLQMRPNSSLSNQDEHRIYILPLPGPWSCSLTSTQAKHLDQTVSAQGIEELSCVLADPLARLFRKSLSSGHILNDCKHANVTHVFKKGQKYFSSNYRPISLACIAYKLMEHICSSIMSHAEQYNIVYPLHYGFRPSRSCETQLLEMVNNTVNSMQLGFQTDVCVLDFSKKLSTRLDINA